MINKRLIFFFLLIFFGSQYIVAQCLEEDPGYHDGEFIKYEVSYNWGLLWVNAGEVYFKTNTMDQEGEKYYRFESYGQTYPFYDWFYKVRDRYEAKVKAKGFKPEYFNRYTSEGGYKVNNEFFYSMEHNKVNFSLYNNKTKSKQDSLILDGCAYDVLSAIYYIRSLDFNHLNSDSSYLVNFLIDGKKYELTIRLRGREIITTRTKKQYSCIKFTSELVAGTIFKEGEELIVWVSDDENKLPILVEARILIGSIKANIQEYQNLKVPMVSIPD